MLLVYIHSEVDEVPAAKVGGYNEVTCLRYFDIYVV